ncbi:MAG: riboflavin kinase / adenylyltransferase [Chloroflexota bacterium]|nr:riboflavin kinase / adenylyltransferase [Chloroflexota bacterium]
MTLERKNDHFNNNAGTWATIGSFDGIHLGHQSIIQKLVEGSRKAGKPSTVVTFFPHPIKVLRGNPGPFYLTSPEEKIRILEAMGVDSVLTLNFTRDLAAQSSDSFIRILYNHTPFSCLLIGYDFRLGANRDGDFHSLSALGNELGYCVRAFEPYLKPDQPVSSSRIREMIRSNDIRGANNLLGRPYSATGRIVHGDARGRQIGLRTANLDIWPEKLLPGGGVYAAFAEVDQRTYHTVVNIGTRPTFYDKPTFQTVEAHLLDFDGDVYDQQIELKFIQHLRPEKKFANSDELMVQIKQDIQFAREVLNNEPKQTDLPA